MKKCPYCAEEIQNEAIVCRHCGRDLVPPTTTSDVGPPKGKPNVNPLVAAVVVIAAAIIVWFAIVARTGSGPSPSSSGRAVLPTPIAAPPPVVTKSEYDQIKEGMTYSQVRSIIGAPGEEISRSDVVGISAVMYAWTNANGSNMNAMFQDGKLVSKAQFGLP